MVRSLQQSTSQPTIPLGMRTALSSDESPSWGHHRSATPIITRNFGNRVADGRRKSQGQLNGRFHNQTPYKGRATLTKE
jgi:hypothetical protein